jgi:serine/threonine protein kinase
LRHPSVCPIHDFGEIEGEPFISMAYIEGHPLSALVASEPPQSETWILMLVRKLALALQVAHDQGVIHRDLKPSNVMIDAHEEPIVMDFGLARHVRGGREDMRLTQSGVLVGSPPYMSPEQVEGDAEQIDARTDQYALGVIVYELLTGMAPFRGTFTNVVCQVLGKQPEPPSQFRPSLDPGLSRSASGCCPNVPKIASPHSSKIVAEEFSAILRDLTLLRKAVPKSTRTKMPRPPANGRSRSALALSATIVVFCILGTATIAWFNRLPRAEITQYKSQTQELLAATTSPSATDELASALRGTIDIQIWDPSNPSRRGLSLADPLALPLHVGDQIKIEASLNRPAYAYVVWTGPDGVARPVYPWRPGDWNLRPPGEHPVSVLSLPEAIDEGWPLKGGPGMETLVLVARDLPLDQILPLREFFASLPVQRFQNIPFIISGYRITL